MGNVSGKEEETSEEREEYMDYAHGGAQVSYPAPPDSMVHSPLRAYPHAQSPYKMTQIRKNIISTRNTEYSDDMQYPELVIPTMIAWCYEGKQVKISGSWDGWETRELLQRRGQDFAVMKVLPPGTYHFQFIVDGQCRYSPDLPHEHDDMGNIFNFLDVKVHVPPVHNDMYNIKSPSSPVSSYNNSPFTKEDFNEKLTELPPLLQQSLLDQPSSSDAPLDTPLPSILNHLYIQKGRSGEYLAALSSTHRFRSKFVTLVLYKPTKRERK